MPPIGSEEVLLALAEHPAWIDAPPTQLGDDGLRHGRGIAFGSWGGGRGPAAATAFLESDGTVSVVIGTVDLSGSFTSLAQIAAEALKLPVDKVVVRKASPGDVPFAPISAGSQTIIAMGAAVQDAALALRGHILKAAALDLGVNEAELDIDSGKVFVANRPGDSLSFEMLHRLTMNWEEYGPLIGQGSSPLRQEAPGVAASLAEVAVDPETGKVSLTRLIIIQDVGKAINPLSVEGQLQGAAVQSIGAAFWEALMYDEQGQVVNPNLLDYRMPTAADLPMIETVLVEAPGGNGPYGAKLVGEPPIVPPVAAVANAVAAAIGRRIHELPLTPERVWRAMYGSPESI
jgi:CO/xanthine dehydrogenase Mo-binding subunit